MTRFGNQGWFERAKEVIPGGVNSPVRAHKSVGGTPFFVTLGSGPYLRDVESNTYIDWVQSWGALLLGHAHPEVVEAVQAAASLGTSFGAPTPGEVRLAEEVKRRFPGCDQVRLTSSGTEATMSAIRLARAATGRDKLVKFDGCYHGHADALLAGGGSGIATLGIPGSAGVPESAVAQTMVVPYNEVPVLDEQVACVIVEPVAANMGLVLPQPGFLEELHRACQQVGALLILDEVITGFRVAAGGATQRLSLNADLWCLGKILGGGLPIGGFGGRSELMSMLAPEGPVYQAGTLSGNPVAVACGLRTLELLDEGAYAALEQIGRSFAHGLEEVFDQTGIPAQVTHVGALAGVFFTKRPVVNYEDAKKAASTGIYQEFFRGMLQRGVYFPPSPYEALFPSLAHDDAVMARTLEAARESALELKKSEALKAT
jgi:glutamate-1-semialdehyde 2,1-aminomutase